MRGGLRWGRDAGLGRVTNPHDFEVDGIRFLGTGGQNVDDVYKYSGLEDRLVVMERLLEWGHLVPTAPDTLTAYPFPDNDPFVLDTAPHVFFAGNQPELGTRVIRGKEDLFIFHPGNLGRNA